jgi:hypothetical protein
VLLIFAALISVSSVGIAIGKDALSLGWAFVKTQEVRSNKQVPRFTESSLVDLLILGDGGDPPLPYGYTGKVNEALYLLKKVVPKGAKVLTFDFTNPYSFALKWASAPGAPIFWHKGVTYNGSVYPDPIQVFLNVDVVLFPKQFGTGDPDELHILKQIYGAQLQQNFFLGETSEQWSLYIRK